MKIIAKHNGITEYQLDKAEWKEMMLKLKGATIHDTFGPNYKNLFWSPIGRPYIKKES